MREPPGDDPITTGRFRDVVERVLEAVLQAAPERATVLGDHRFDDQLTDYAPSATSARAAMLTDALAALDEVDDTGLIVDDRVDLEMLRTQVTGDLWELTELRPHERNPLMHLPGEGLYPLIVGDAMSSADRLRGLSGRLALVPHRLATAREVLHDMPSVQVETALAQTRETQRLLVDGLPPLLGESSPLASRTALARDEALAALAEHLRWLAGQLPAAEGDPRLGEQAYAARLWYGLDTETAPDALLTRAESDLQAIEEQIAEVASELAGAPPHADQVRQMLERSAAAGPVTDQSVLPLCRAALTHLTQRVVELGLVTVPEAAAQVTVRPSDRPSRAGLEAAYCDPPGPLGSASTDGASATSIVVSRTPRGWDGERVASFYREYNAHRLRNLAVHEAMPGHVLQLAHAAGHRGTTRVRSVAWSGPFIEGWAGYAEELIAIAGFGDTAENDLILRLQQLKTQLRITINAILDVRVHAHGMTEDEALELMIRRGHQERSEAAGTWCRALLTSARLATDYVGYRELSEIARRLRAAQPGWSDRRLHDAMLAHGSPAPRHLRVLLELE